MTPHPTEATRPEAVENEDPVCGMAVPADSHYRYVHDGQTYLFCSAHCLARFQASPTGYIDAPEAQPSAVHGGALYTCPMHPEIRLSSPGVCPKCGMALEEASTDT